MNSPWGNLAQWGAFVAAIVALLLNYGAAKRNALLQQFATFERVRDRIHRLGEQLEGMEKEKDTPKYRTILTSYLNEFDWLGHLVEKQAVPQDMVASQMKPLALQTWQDMRPFVDETREVCPLFCAHFESLTRVMVVPDKQDDESYRHASL